MKKQEQFHSLCKDVHQIKVCFGHKHKKELFEQIVSWLDSHSICGLEHSQIESKLLENGYELLRRLL
ncbi:MAG: ISKra4 family transposase, partial [Richelia sp.]|nr:ISKra4 family transposase [Richelia sp.]